MLVERKNKEGTVLITRENRPIQKRVLLALPFCLKTPLCISSGEELETDKDVICDFDGNPLIPAASLAGAMRDYLSLDSQTESFMGHQEKSNASIQTIGLMSKLSISDTILKEAHICYRNGIALKRKDNIKQKTEGTEETEILLSKQFQVDNKFDWEVIDAGAVGCFWLELTIRDGDDEQKTMNQIKAAFAGMNQGALRLGYRKNRGFGCITLLQVYQWEFTRDNVTEWLQFEKPKMKQDKQGEWSLGTQAKDYKQNLDEWLTSTEVVNRDACLIVPLRLTGGISIRQYSTKSDEADYEHITSHGEAVVPGTSWNGPIRGRFMEIAMELGASKHTSQTLTERWFGSLNHKSWISIEESVLPRKSGATAIQISRNQINRFDASTTLGSLYTEIACFQGRTQLVIRVNKCADTDNEEWKVVLGLLWLVIQDIQMGFLPIGGLRAIGRGIFAADGAVIWQNACTQKEAEQALIAFLQKNGGNADDNVDR
ncbi:MAG: RAMP superfamily CRISPR-associated protein [Lachnospiraceae bacterium]